MDRNHGPHRKQGLQKVVGREIRLIGLDCKTTNQNHSTVQDKKDFLFRKNEGKRLCPQYLGFLNRILKLDLTDNDFVDLKKSDELNKIYFEQISIREKKINKKFDLNSQLLLIFELENVVALFSNKKIFLLGEKSKYCGAILLPIDMVIKNYQELIEYDGDSLMLISEEMSSGMMIDFYDEPDEDRVRKNYYELLVW